MRDRRVERVVTLEEQAERSRVSRRMVVDVEQGASSASLATVPRSSDALGVGLPAPAGAQRPGALRTIPAGQAPVLCREAGGRTGLVAGTDPPDVVESWGRTLEPGDAHRTEAHAAGTRELLLVLAGLVQLTVGQQRQVLSAGGAARFAGDVTHGCANPATDGSTARFALTVFEPHVTGRSGR